MSGRSLSTMSEPPAPAPLLRAQLPVAEYADFYAGYVAAVPADETIDDALAGSLRDITAWLDGLPPARGDYAYAPGKWTVAQSLQHVLDTERIFTFHALSFARGERAPLPGFHQDAYAAAAPAAGRTLTDLADELRAVRAATRMLFASFDDEALARAGTMSGVASSCRALGFVTAGHCYHHAALFRERYTG